MKNTFKKPVITYDPIRQEKPSFPFWCQTSIQGISQRKETFSAVSSILVIAVVLGLMLTLVHIVGG